MAKNLTAHVLEGASFQYPLSLTSSTTIGQAAAAAGAELKRKQTEKGSDPIQTFLRSVRHKGRDGRVKEEIMDTNAKMQSSYELQLEVESDVDLLERRAEEEEFRRFSLKPLVFAYASAVASRMVSGAPRSDEDMRISSGLKNLLQEESNQAKVNLFLKETSLNMTPMEFAEALDKNYDDRNKLAHNTTDEHLAETAIQLKRMGAVRLLRQVLPVQCALIEHFALAKEHLLG